MPANPVPGICMRTLLRGGSCSSRKSDAKALADTHLGQLPVMALPRTKTRLKLSSSGSLDSSMRDLDKEVREEQA